MKHVKKMQNTHKTAGTSKKERNRNKRKKQGITQVKKSVSMKSRTKLKNKQTVKKCIDSLDKNTQPKYDIVNIKKNPNANSVGQVKQELAKKSGKKSPISKHNKLHKKQMNKIKNVQDNVTIAIKPQQNKKEQKVTNRFQNKQQARVHKLRVLIEKRIREEENVESPNTEQKTENSKARNSTVNSKQVRGTVATKEPNDKSEQHQEPQSLRDRMMAHLRASRFRFINEGLYTSDSSESKNYFKEDPDAFKAYHEGYKQQVEQWPVNPLDIIISRIQQLPKDYIIADMGCGEGRLATSVPHKVHSFDLVSVNEWIKASDITHTPLLTTSVHVVVFCLSLMGTNLHDYIIEANRVLKKDGILKIAEVESRFERVDEFIQVMNDYGFTNTWKDLSHNLFYFMDFKKVQDITVKRDMLPQITLKPCLYKKR